MVKQSVDNENFMTFDKANELFTYDPDTGIITWRKKVSLSQKEGTVAGNSRKDGYIRVGFQGRRFLAHRLAWLLFHGEHPKEQVDHINRNRSDNRICNLRAASHSDNTRNASLYSNNTSGYKCVVKCGKKWGAIIHLSPAIWLGTFDTKEQAAEAYAAAARLHFGEFANPAKADPAP